MRWSGLIAAAFAAQLSLGAAGAMAQSPAGPCWDGDGWNGAGWYQCGLSRQAGRGWLGVEEPLDVPEVGTGGAVTTVGRLQPTSAPLQPEASEEPVVQRGPAVPPRAAAPPQAARSSLGAGTLVPTHSRTGSPSTSQRSADRSYSSPSSSYRSIEQRTGRFAPPVF